MNKTAILENIQGFLSREWMDHYSGIGCIKKITARASFYFGHLSWKNWVQVDWIQSVGSKFYSVHAKNVPKQNSSLLVTSDEQRTGRQVENECFFPLRFYSFRSPHNLKSLFKLAESKNRPTQGPDSRKSRKRFEPEKTFVTLRPAYSVKLWPVSQTFRNFSGLFRVPQFP